MALVDLATAGTSLVTLVTRSQATDLATFTPQEAVLSRIGALADRKVSADDIESYDASAANGDGSVGAKHVFWRKYVDGVPLQTHVNGFVAAAHLAFAKDLGLQLAADDVWAVILSGAASIIQQHPEEARTALVAHKDRKLLRVDNDHLVKDKGKEPAQVQQWAFVLDQFRDRLGEDLGPDFVANTICAPYSTSTPLTMGVFAVNLMDMCRAYYDFRTRTLCGIPYVRLLGTADDWTALRTRALALLDRLGTVTSFWRPHLAEALDVFVDTASNTNHHELWWQSWYKWASVSGGDSVTGNIHALFPLVYTRGVLGENKNMGEKNRRHGGSLDQFPQGLTNVDVLWEYIDTEVPLKFVAGFNLPLLHADGFVQPAHFWSVVHKRALEPVPRQEPQPVVVPLYQRAWSVTDGYAAPAFNDDGLQPHAGLGPIVVPDGLDYSALSPQIRAVLSAIPLVTSGHLRPSVPLVPSGQAPPFGSQRPVAPVVQQAPTPPEVPCAICGQMRVDHARQIHAYVTSADF
jgi:hypothetical protein